MRESGRSPVWGGATLGFLAGLVIGFFTADYWRTVLHATVIGVALGIGSQVLFRATHRPLRDPYAGQPLVIRPSASAGEILAEAFGAEWQSLTGDQRDAIVRMFERAWKDEQKNYPTVEAGVQEFRRIVGGQLGVHADLELRYGTGVPGKGTEDS